jgi:hypothetical protein
MTKITPEIKKFIESNCTLSDTALSGLIEKNFNIKITARAIDPHLQKARSATQATNNAKVEAVRAAVLDDAQRYAGKYLAILDKEIEAWDKLLTDAKDVPIEDVKGRAVASQALQKCISMVLEFAKPSEGPSPNESWADTRTAILMAVDNDPKAKAAICDALEHRRRHALRPEAERMGEGGSGDPAGSLADQSPEKPITKDNSQL